MIPYELLDSNEYELAQMDDENQKIPDLPVLLSQKIFILENIKKGAFN